MAQLSPASVPPRIDARALTPLSWAIAAEEFGAAAGRPVVIELDGDDQPAWTPEPIQWWSSDSASRAGRAPFRALHPCDVVIAADDPALPELLEGVATRPLASTSLAVLLRRTGQADVEVDGFRVGRLLDAPVRTRVRRVARRPRSSSWCPSPGHRSAASGETAAS